MASEGPQSAFSITQQPDALLANLPHPCATKPDGATARHQPRSRAAVVAQIGPANTWRELRKLQHTGTTAAYRCRRRCLLAGRERL
jgi:hypothetical protein